VEGPLLIRLDHECLPDRLVRFHYARPTPWHQTSALPSVPDRAGAQAARVLGAAMAPATQGSIQVAAGTYAPDHVRDGSGPLLRQTESGDRGINQG
jgi:hypothetical protein